MMDWILGGVIALTLGLAVYYLVRTRKSGTECIGCSCGSCKSKCGSDAGGKESR